MKLCLFLICFIVYAEGCARTSGTITTTVSPTTTTTLACMTCSEGSFNPNTPDPVAPPGSPDVHGATIATGMDANGCSTLTVTCTAGAAGLTLLSLYSNADGPRGFVAGDPNGAPVVMQTLNCADGQWTFTANLDKPNELPVTKVINGASCFG